MPCVETFLRTFCRYLSDLKSAFSLNRIKILISIMHRLMLTLRFGFYLFLRVIIYCSFILFIVRQIKSKITSNTGVQIEQNLAPVDLCFLRLDGTF